MRHSGAMSRQTPRSPHNNDNAMGDETVMQCTHKVSRLQALRDGDTVALKGVKKHATSGASRNSSDAEMREGWDSGRNHKD